MRLGSVRAGSISQMTEWLYGQSVLRTEDGDLADRSLKSISAAGQRTVHSLRWLRLNLGEQPRSRSGLSRRCHRK